MVGIQAKVDNTFLPGYYKTTYLYTERPLVTIVIPNKDHTEDLDRCVRSLLATKEYTNFEILIIENNSEDQATFDYYEKLKKQDERIRVETWKMDNTLTLINTAKYQIKILCTIKIWTETADLFYNRCLHCKKVTDIIVCVKKIWIII